MLKLKKGNMRLFKLKGGGGEKENKEENINVKD